MTRAVAAELRRLVRPDLVAAALAVHACTALGVVYGMSIDVRTAGLAHSAAAATATAAGAALAVAQSVATSGGVVMAAAIAVGLVAAEYTSGSMPTVLMFESRRGVLLLRKLLAGLLAFQMAVLAGWLLLWGIASVARTLWYESLPAAPVPWSQAVGALARALPVAVLFLVGAGLCALVARSDLMAGAIFVGAVLATMPLNRLRGMRDWLPHHWISTWLDLDPSWQFVTYVWPHRAPDPYGGAIAVVGLSVAVAVGAWWRFSRTDIHVSPE